MKTTAAMTSVLFLAAAAPLLFPSEARACSCEPEGELVFPGPGQSLASNDATLFDFFCGPALGRFEATVDGSLVDLTLYRRLVEIAPSPVTELNAAIALAMSGSISDALSWVNSIERRKTLSDYHLFAAVKAGLLARAGHLRQARRYYGRARKLARNDAERRYLTRRIEEMQAELSRST